MRHWTALLAAALCMAAGGCGKPQDVNELLDGALREVSSGNFDRAAVLAGKAARRAPDRQDVLVLRLLLLEKSGGTDEALRSAARLAEKYQDSFAVQYTAGRLFSADGRHAHDALKALGRAIALRPGDRNTQILLCNVHMKLDPAQARKHLLSLARYRFLFDSGAYQNQLGVAQLRSRNYHAAGQAFLKACRKVPGEPVYLFNLACCMDRFLGKRDVASKLYQRYLDLAPKTSESAEMRNMASARLYAIRKL